MFNEFSKNYKMDLGDNKLKEVEKIYLQRLENNYGKFYTS